MGTMIVKQAESRYALWSTVVDNFIAINLTKEKVIEYFVKEQEEQIKKMVDRVLDSLADGENPYAQFTLSFDECVSTIRDIHGEDDEVLKVLGITE